MIVYFWFTSAFRSKPSLAFTLARLAPLLEFLKCSAPSGQCRFSHEPLSHFISINIFTHMQPASGGLFDVVCDLAMRHLSIYGQKPHLCHVPHIRSDEGFCGAGGRTACVWGRVWWALTGVFGGGASSLPPLPPLPFSLPFLFFF